MELFEIAGAFIALGLVAAAIARRAGRQGRASVVQANLIGMAQIVATIAL
jgi:hypothetical protein